jgi:predicted RNA-binding Zn ribbon-like protein
MIVTMTHPAAPLSGYQPIGGALCLDFANTVDWHDSDHPVELLNCAESLSIWARLVGTDDGGVDDADLRCATELRDAVWEVLRAVVDEAPIPPNAVAVLNRNLELAPEHRSLTVVDSGVAWSDRTVRGADALLARIARSAADLLTDPDRLKRVRMCAAEGCGWLFVDDSRGARRRWCSMQSCGNRAKARAHYRRKQI